MQDFILETKSFCTKVSLSIRAIFLEALIIFESQNTDFINCLSVNYFRIPYVLSW